MPRTKIKCVMSATERFYCRDERCAFLQEGMTPLHLAARFGHLKVLECLNDFVSLNVSSIKVISP